MIDGWLLVGFGFTLGVILTTFGLWLPSRAHWRQLLEDHRETFRIEAGYRAAPADADLADAAGAYAQASAAYLPVYPGRGEPDQGWLSWLKQAGLSYYGSRDGQDAYRTSRSVQVYRPSHLTVDHEPTEPISPPAPLILQRWDSPGDQFPVWGAPAPTSPAPMSWGLAWGWRDWLLAPPALAFASLPATRQYPWWQKVADRIWEASVVFETRGAQINRRLQRELDQVVEFAADCGALAVTLSVQAASTALDWWAAARTQMRRYSVREGFPWV